MGLAACSGATSQLLSTVGAPLPAASAAPSAAAAGEDTSGNGPAPSSQPGNETQPDPNLKIVYTGSLQMVVGNVADALARSKTAVAAAGGYIGASQESNDGDQPSATITYRIPATKWDETIAAIRGVGTKVVHEETKATEVGGQLVDLEARIANLRASESALQKIAEGAGNVNDLLQVQAQLTDVRGQIEQLDGQRAHLVDQVAYGTLVTTFGVAVEQVKTAAKGWDPASDVDGATATILSLGQHLVSAAIWFVIVWVPALLLIAIGAFIAWKVFRRLAPRGDGPSGVGTSGWGQTPPPPAPPAS
jgi:Domain of unknown function (DUF4349)